MSHAEMAPAQTPEGHALAFKIGDVTGLTRLPGREWED
jgi:hypothetical protein